MSKEACVFVIDVGRSMGQIVQGTLTGLDKAKKAVSLFIQQKLLFTKQDELGIVVVGSEDTANPLNEEDSDNYQHVKVIQEIARPAVDFLQKIDEIDVEDASGDVIDGLLVAMAMIKSRVGKLKFSKRIFLITDGASDIVDDPAAMETICDGLNNDEFRLNIVGIDFHEDEDDDDDDEKKQVKSEHKEDVHRTRTQIANEKLLRDLADKVGGAVFTAKGAVSMLSMFRSRSVNQVTLFRGNLEIGEHLNLSVYAYGKTMMMNMPSLKKLSVPASEAAEPDTMAVKMERSYWNKKADKETAVDREEMIKAFRYGKEQIPFSDEDMANLKYQCDKGLQVIGFTPTSKVKRHEYMGKVDCIVSEPGNKKSAFALSALIHALLETDHVAVVRYVKRQNATPKLGILIPEVTSEYECLYFNQLPFAEDVRDFSFASLTENPKNVPNDRQLSAVRDLVNSLDLMKGDDDGYAVEALQPELTFNPVLQRFYQCVEKRALDPSAPITDLDPAIAKYVNPDPNMIKSAAPAYKKLKEQFHLVKVEKKDKSEKRHWRDYFDVGAVDADLEQLKRSRVDTDEKHGDVDMKFADIVTRHADKVGAVNPVEDFKSMISRRDDPTIVKRACEEMQAIIKTIVIKSYGDSQFPQALNCVIALRDGCVENEEAELFNKGLKDLREATKKKEAFWKMMSENSVFPIDRTEVPDSSFTREEAHAFYAGAPSTSSAPSVNISEEDLFESMD